MTAFRDRQRAALEQGRLIGIGIGNYVEGTGLGPFEGVTVRVLPSGKVAVATGATSQGQGTRTTLSQIVAEQVGCRIDDIVMTVGDTGAIAQGVGAFASRQAVNAGCSAQLAGEAVRTQIIALAARALGVDGGDIDLEDGLAIATTGNKPTIPFGELARLAQGIPGVSLPAGQAAGLEHTAYYTPPQAAYCSGTHVAEVEVDHMTGGVKVLNYAVAHDSGRVINPLIVDGQVQGGVAHGIGNALLEWMQYDDNAQPLTTTFADYLLPMATDVPTCAIAHVETVNPLNPLGVKGAGEGGTIPAPAAIISAIEDALSPFDVHFAETPLTPERIVAALRAAGAYREVAIGMTDEIRIPQSRRFGVSRSPSIARPACRTPASPCRTAAASTSICCCFCSGSPRTAANCRPTTSRSSTTRCAAGASSPSFRSAMCAASSKARQRLVEPGKQEAFRDKVKAVELEAEQLQQAALYNFTKSGPLGAPGSPRAAARANVAAYEGARGVNFPKEAADLLTAAFDGIAAYGAKSGSRSAGRICNVAARWHRVAMPTHSWHNSSKEKEGRNGQNCGAADCRHFRRLGHDLWRAHPGNAAQGRDRDPSGHVEVGGNDAGL